MQLVTLTGEFHVGKVNFETAYPHWAGSTIFFPRTMIRKKMDGLESYRQHYAACCWPSVQQYAEESEAK